EPQVAPAEPQPATRERLLAVAQAAAERLEALALHGANDISWLGLTFLNQRNWWLSPLGVDLYAGISGVAFFLGYFGAIAGEPRSTRLAQRAMATVCGQLEQLKAVNMGIGGFTGWGGLIYTMMHLDALWDMPSLSAHIDDLLEWLPSRIERDRQYDIIGGAAGCVAALLSLYRWRRREPALAIAVQCSDWLIANAEHMEQGIAWPFNVGKSKPLTGYAHGAA